jgi:hypothetical protein
MPVNIVPAGVFTDPVTRPVDGDLANGASWQQPLQALTDRTAFLADQLGGNDGLGEWTFKGGARTRILEVSLFDAIIDYGGTDLWSRPTNPDSLYSLESKGGSQPRLLVPITKYLREGMVIVSTRMLCVPGDNPSSFPTMSLGLRYVAPTLDPLAVAAPAPTGVGSNEASSGTTRQVVVQSIGGGGHTVVRYTNVSNRSRGYWLLIRGTDSNGLSAGNLDVVEGLGVEILDPGPRNG